MPETTRSQRPSISTSRPSVTQSVGVPLVAKPFMPLGRVIGVMRRGLCRVMACPAALRGRSGATIQTSPSASRAILTAWRPGAWTPSSLVSRIRMAPLISAGGPRLPSCSPPQAAELYRPPRFPLRAAEGQSGLGWYDFEWNCQERIKSEPTGLLFVLQAQQQQDTNRLGSVLPGKRGANGVAVFSLARLLAREGRHIVSVRDTATLKVQAVEAFVRTQRFQKGDLET